MRCFIAVDLDEPIRRDLNRLIDRLRPSCPKVQWVRPENLHLTIKFLGEIAPAKIASIAATLDQLCSQCRPFDIQLRGLGVFPPAGPVRVIWVGVEDEDGRLHAAQRQCEAALELLGLSRERRPYSAHLTIARNKSPAASGPLRRTVEEAAEFSAGSQSVHGLTLYESTLSPGGSIYQILSRHRFAS